MSYCTGKLLTFLANRLLVRSFHLFRCDVHATFCCYMMKVVSRLTKIPITTLGREEEKLSHLADRLHERVVGQHEAVNLVAQEVLRSRVGFDQSGQPIGSFLFLGPAGVGKTELAKALAEKLFDNEKALVRFDMSEYADNGSVSRLIGGPRRFSLYTLCTCIVFLSENSYSCLTFSFDFLKL
jgi:AAA+ superfamily predicted ATPase